MVNGCVMKKKGRPPGRKNKKLKIIVNNKKIRDGKTINSCFQQEAAECQCSNWIFIQFKPFWYYLVPYNLLVDMLVVLSRAGSVLNSQVAAWVGESNPTSRKLMYRAVKQFLLLSVATQARR